MRWVEPDGTERSESFAKRGRYDIPGTAEHFEHLIETQFSRGTYADPDLAQTPLCVEVEKWVQRAQTETTRYQRRYFAGNLGDSPLCRSDRSVRPISATGSINSPAADHGVTGARSARIRSRYSRARSPGSGTAISTCPTAGSMSISRPVTFRGRPPTARLKSRTSKRAVPLPRDAHEALETFLEHNFRQRRDLLFRTKAGNIWTADAMGDRFRVIGARANIPDHFTWHDLRHFYASALIEQGASMRTVQARLGHADPQTTLRIYTHLWPDNDESTRTPRGYGYLDF